MTHPTLTDLREALAYVAEMITRRPDGETYLPIFQALEAEIETRAAQESAIDRARRLARERAEKVAA